MSSPLSLSGGNRPLEQLKVAELKEELRKRNLSLKGVKKELFERLEEAIRKDGCTEILLSESIEGEGANQEGVNFLEDMEREGDKKNDDPSSDVINTVLDNQEVTTVDCNQNAVPSPKDLPSKTAHLESPPHEIEPRKGLDNVVCGNDDIVSSLEDGEKSSMSDPCCLNSGTCAQEHVDDQAGLGAYCDFPGTLDQGSRASQEGAIKTCGFFAGENECPVEPSFVDPLTEESGHPSSDQMQDCSQAQEAAGPKLNFPEMPLKQGSGVSGDSVEALVSSVQAQVDTKVDLAADVPTDVEMAEAKIDVAERLDVPDDVEMLEAHDIERREVKPKELHALLSIIPLDEANRVPVEAPLDRRKDTIALVKSPASTEQEQEEMELKVEELVKVDPQGPDEDVPTETVKVEYVDPQDGRDSSRAEHETPLLEVFSTLEYMEDGSRLEGRALHKDSHKELKELDSKSFIEREQDKSKQEFSKPSKYRDKARDEPSEDAKEMDSKNAETKKHKPEDVESMQQEPAKRQRRWISGNNAVTEVEAKERMYLEAKGNTITVAKTTIKFLTTPGPTVPMVKGEPDLNGDKAKPRVVPPPKRPPTTSLRIDRFIRPFTLNAVKDLLSEFGKYIDFWMDQIKTHCYVMYSSVDEATAARNGLYDRQWPPSFGNTLVADFVDPHEVKIRSEGLIEKMHGTIVSTPRVPHPPALVAPVAAPSNLHMGPLPLPPPPPLRERQFLPPVNKDPDPVVPTLDDLFKKTKAKPHIYYLPLSGEQVAALDVKEFHLKSKQAVRS